MPRSELPVLPVVALVSVVALLLGLINVDTGGPAAIDPGPADATLVRILPPNGARRLPDDFLGLSLEYTALEPYAGANPAALDSVFVQLVRNLAPGGHPVLRIGGDTADSTWWPAFGLTQPPGVRFSLDRTWLAVARALTAQLGARVMFGLNFEADDPRLAKAEIAALGSAAPPGATLAYELGNEPELYGSFPWYRSGGHGVLSRPRGYDWQAFLSDFTRFSAALGNVALAGPTTGGTGWSQHLDEFAAAEPKVAILTVHRYPLQLCFTARRSPKFPTIAHLLSPAASTGLAATFAPEVAIAHAHARELRVDEFNTVSCGADPAVSMTFASALWALDALFEVANIGADGVNVHTFPGAGYELFRIRSAGGHWTAAVAPEYYGLLMFAAAAPAGSRLLKTSGVPWSAVKTWATLGADGRVRVLIINKSALRAHAVAFRPPGRADGIATIERLTAPGLRAGSGVTLAGQSFGAQTTTGRFAESPHTDGVSAAGGMYSVSVAPASAVLLTLPSDAA